MKKRASWVPLFLFAFFCATVIQAEDRKEDNIKKKAYTMIGNQAPLWDVDHWKNLGEKKSLSIEDLNGKVVYLYCFQSWCPGCHSHGFPTLVKLINHYKDNDAVAFVAVQTAFEGHYTNTPEAAWKTAEKYGLAIPVGHSGSVSKRSKIMNAYKTRGTPWTVIIDPEGTIKYNDFHISVNDAIKLIDTLIKKKDIEPSNALDTK